MKKFVLRVIWENGERNEYSYNSKESAQEHERGFKTAFGNQITFTCILERGFYV